jgi:hypothetical protein
VPVITSGGTGGTGTALPSGWQTSATTQASFTETVDVISQYLGTAKGEAFQTWYTAAWAKDPSLTPDAASATWLTGADLTGAISNVAGLLGKIPQAVATPLEQDVGGSGSGSACPTPSGLNTVNPAAWIGYVVCIIKADAGDFLIRGIKIVAGTVLLISGLIHMSGIDKNASAILSKVPVIPA